MAQAVGIPTDAANRLTRPTVGLTSELSHTNYERPAVMSAAASSIVDEKSEAVPFGSPSREVPENGAANA